MASITSSGSKRYEVFVYENDVIHEQYPNAAMDAAAKAIHQHLDKIMDSRERTDLIHEDLCNVAKEDLKITSSPTPSKQKILKSSEPQRHTISRKPHSVNRKTGCTDSPYQT
ncbi:hypothetical protein ACEWF6_04110 [Bifidobacterium catenulatum subsp. kashiwanohense]|uniref:hypothetical protein n=1 Tax=Bifidobacterium catenulatum TaxID=1686 RepID=UPI003D03B8CB